MYRKTVLIIMFAFTIFLVKAQTNIMNKGFNNLVLGITESQLDDIVGFPGTKINADDYYSKEVQGRKKENLPEFKTGFDQCEEYKFIMPIPVTRVFLKESKVVMIEVSSYPDFTRPICLDSKTAAGLKFWDSKDSMEKLYGKNYRADKSADGNTSYYYYDSKGIGFAVTNNEVRIIYFY